MADINKAIRIIQGKTQNFDNDYKGSIKDALEVIWAQMAGRLNLVHLRSSTPYEITIVADQAYYTIDKENVGRLLHMTNDIKNKNWLYREPEEFQNLLYGVTDNSDDAVSIFTIDGIVNNGRLRIRIWPTPTEGETVYLYYEEEGSASSFARMPNSLLTAAIHGAMAMVAPPMRITQQNGNMWWRSVTKDEYLLYDIEMRKYGVSILPATPEHPPVDIDRTTESRIKEINEL